VDAVDTGQSFYFFDIDDNLLFLPTKLYLWNAETKTERAVTSGEYAAIQNLLGRPGLWQDWTARDETFRDFRDKAGVAGAEQQLVKDLLTAMKSGTAWQGRAWPLLVHCAKNGRAIAMVSARGHAPETIEAALRALVERQYLQAIPPILGIYTVTNPGVRERLGATAKELTVPQIKKRAIKDAVRKALELYGADPPHRFGMSDDDPNNVVLAISAMRDCKLEYPDKRFFVINTNHEEYVKLEIFPMAHPVTASDGGKHLLKDTGHEEHADAAAKPSHRGDSSAGHGPAAAGAPAARSQKGHVTGRQTISGGNASVYVSSLDRAVPFYTERLGLRLKTRIGDEWAEVDAGEGLIIGLHPARPPQTVEAGTAGAINIELRVSGRLEDTIAAIKARGVTTFGEIQSYDNVRLVSVADPDGNVILLAQVLH
jgi:predicted enzyme related to lactoylglutathione lyase